jgi:hypothetical protein
MVLRAALAVPSSVSLSRRGSVAAVHRHDAGAAEAQVVLERDFRAPDLALVGLAAPDITRASVEGWQANPCIGRAVAFDPICACSPSFMRVLP